jgi:hypothetical protein
MIAVTHTAATPRPFAGSAPTRAVVLRYQETTLVVLADGILAIDQDGAEARVRVGDSVVDLSDFVDGSGTSPGADETPVRLIVQIAGRRVAFRAVATLELAEVGALYRLPRLLRDAGCRPWVRGLAVLERRLAPVFEEDAGSISEPPALWIDLEQLARTQVLGLPAETATST